MLRNALCVVVVSVVVVVKRVVSIVSRSLSFVSEGCRTDCGLFEESPNVQLPLL
jgi:hypothetical protein